VRCRDVVNYEFFGVFSVCRFPPTVFFLVGHQTITAYSRMGHRQKTIICCFDPRSPHITAFQIHERIYRKIHLDEEDILMIQTDGTRRQVFIRFKHSMRLHNVMIATK